jgi:DNA polymerase I-like protein with 3'-5' exonuclease and polymerase domains
MKTQKQIKHEIQEQIKINGVIAIDTETTGLKFGVDKPFGISLSTDNEDYYWDVRECPTIINDLQSILDDDNLNKVVCHNAPFDYHMLRAIEVNIPITKIDDTIIRARLIDETLDHNRMGSYSLDYLGEHYLGQTKHDDIYNELAQLFGGKASRNAQMKNIAQAPSHIVEPYAKKDTRLTYDLFKYQQKQIIEQDIAGICKFENEIQHILLEIESRGIKVDVERAKEAYDELTNLIDEDFIKLEQLVGKKINVNSPVQIRSVFNPQPLDNGEWEIITDKGKVKIPSTKTGNPSLGQEELMSIGTDVANLIADLRTHIKARDTYIKKFVIEGAVNGRLYPSWNQILDTGRLSIRNPSMQNIPMRNKKVSKVIKKLFLPDDGQEWVDCDLSSNEVRIFAHLASQFNDSLVQEYKKNPHLDLHQYVADLTGLPRNPVKGGGGNGKQLNLSSIFNQGRGAAAEKMGLPWSWDSFLQNGKVITYKKAGKEANEIIDRYHNRVGGVKELAENCEYDAKRFGFITTELGRKIRFPNQRKTYKASGMLIQATAADINKQILMFTHNVCKKYGGRLLINIHDSYSLTLPKKHIDKVMKILMDEVQFPKHRTPTRVPLLLELSGVGENWWEAVGGEK